MNLPIRIFVIKLNIQKVSKRNQNFVFYFDSSKFNFSIVDILVKEYGSNISFSPGKDPYITLKSKTTKDYEQLQEIKDFLKFILNSTK
mgnify:CR=1 FL=1